MNSMIDPKSLRVTASSVTGKSATYNSAKHITCLALDENSSLAYKAYNTYKTT